MTEVSFADSEHAYRPLEWYKGGRTVRQLTKATLSPLFNRGIPASPFIQRPYSTEWLATKDLVVESLNEYTAAFIRRLLVDFLLEICRRPCILSVRCRQRDCNIEAIGFLCSFTLSGLQLCRV